MPIHPKPRPPQAPSQPRRAPVKVEPLSDRELDTLQALLDQVPAPHEALDVSMLDGYLCGVLIQPRPIATTRWLPHVTDIDGRALPAAFDASRLHALVLRRHAELDDVIVRRQWFDPWVFELEAEADERQRHAGRERESAGDIAATEAPAAIDAVYPWVAGMAAALELFPDLMALDAQTLIEPLALLYRHLAADDLEDADDLLDEIESLEPPQDLADAVEGLVRATLLLADSSRPTTSRPPGVKTTAPGGRSRRPGRGSDR